MKKVQSQLISPQRPWTEALSLLPIHMPTGTSAVDYQTYYTPSL